MQARMTNPVQVLPDALTALIGLSKAAESGTVPAATHKLVHLRASQINGCGVCVDMHARELKQAGESDERIFGVAAWRETPYFTDAERAALNLTEARPGSPTGPTRCPTTSGTTRPTTTTRRSSPAWSSASPSSTRGTASTPRPGRSPVLRGASKSSPAPDRLV